MRKIEILIILLFISILSFSQKLTWKTELHFFFDNTEFAGSPYTIDQTMAGVTLGQFAGWKFDNNHRVITGLYATKNLGTHKTANDFRFLAYYQYKDKNTFFNAGSFARYDLLDDYSNFFFQDSVNFYKQNMDGLYLKKGDDNRFIKLWLDWTGLQSDTVRESFFLGVSAYKAFTKHFYADFQSYLFHYAGTRPSHPDQHVCDNFLSQASVGYQYSDEDWKKIVVSGGIMAGFERNRKNLNDYYIPVGFVGKADAVYKQFGMENLVYLGQPRMKLYNQFGNDLYWGNPFLRGKFYWQNKLFWNVFHTKNVKGQLASRTHLSEGKLYVEQLFTLSVNIGR